MAQKISPWLKRSNISWAHLLTSTWAYRHFVPTANLWVTSKMFMTKIPKLLMESFWNFPGSVQFYLFSNRYAHFGIKLTWRSFLISRVTHTRLGKKNGKPKPKFLVK
jgi:hypothetical protein